MKLIKTGARRGFFALLATLVTLNFYIPPAYHAGGEPK
jgi:hypothetical protein